MHTVKVVIMPDLGKDLKYLILEEDAQEIASIITNPEPFIQSCFPGVSNVVEGWRMP